jgi:hypothetical protein
VQFPIRGSSAPHNCVWCATSLAVPVDTAWYVTEEPDRERILIAGVVGMGIGKSRRPFCSCVISTESRCPRRMVNEVEEMSPAQDPDSIAPRPGAAKVYGVPQVVTLGEVRALPQPAIVPSTSTPISNPSARITSQHYGQPSAVSRTTNTAEAAPVIETEQLRTATRDCRKVHCRVSRKPEAEKRRRSGAGAGRAVHLL